MKHAIKRSGLMKHAIKRGEGRIQARNQARLHVHNQRPSAVHTDLGERVNRRSIGGH